MDIIDALRDAIINNSDIECEGDDFRLFDNVKSVDVLDDEKLLIVFATGKVCEVSARWK